MRKEEDVVYVYVRVYVVCVCVLCVHVCVSGGDLMLHVQVGMVICGICVCVYDCTCVSVPVFYV